MIIWHQIRPGEVQRIFTESFSVEPNSERPSRLVSVPRTCSGFTRNILMERRELSRRLRRLCPVFFRRIPAIRSIALVERGPSQSACSGS